MTVSTVTSPTTNITSDCVYMIKNISTDKYLTATSSTQVSVATKNEYDGRQLWYVQWTGSGYHLYSLGIKDVASSGRNETLLRGYDVNSSPRVQSNYPVFSKWNISYNSSNGYYYLTNTYNNTSLSADASSNSVKHTLLTSETGYARWQFEKITTSTFNNFYSGNYNGQGSHIYIKISADSGLYENNYMDASNLGVTDMWNDLSSNVTIYGLNDAVPESINTFSITYLGYTPSDPANNYGVTQAYKKTLLGYEAVSPNENFDKINIFINTHSSSPFSSETTDVTIEKVIIHELGHALQLAHPMEPNGLQSVTNGRNEYPDNFSVLAVMNQNNPNNTTNKTAATPKWHDIINLINRWGA